MVERVSKSDRALIVLTQQRVQAMQENLAAHLTSRYGLKPGDQVDDVTGLITRAGAAAAPAVPTAEAST